MTPSRIPIHIPVGDFISCEGDYEGIIGARAGTSMNL